MRLWQRDPYGLNQLFLNLLKELFLRSECAETVDIRNFRTFIYLLQRFWLRLLSVPRAVLKLMSMVVQGTLSQAANSLYYHKCLVKIAYRKELPL